MLRDVYWDVYFGNIVWRSNTHVAVKISDLEFRVSRGGDKSFEDFAWRVSVKDLTYSTKDQLLSEKTEWGQRPHKKPHLPLGTVKLLWRVAVLNLKKLSLIKVPLKSTEQETSKESSHMKPRTLSFLEVNPLKLYGYTAIESWNTLWDKESTFTESPNFPLNFRIID